MGAPPPMRAIATALPSSRSSCSAAAGRIWPRPLLPRRRRTQRPRSRPRRASTGRCRRRSMPCSAARSRRTRRIGIGRAPSWSQISGRRSPTAPRRRCGWSQRRRRPQPRPSPRPCDTGRTHSRALLRSLPALGALALLGIVLAAVVGRGGDEALPPTTVVRTATVAGETQVRTVTVEAQPADASRRRGPRARRRRCRLRRAGPPSTTRGSGCSGAAMQPPRCRFSSVRSPRCRAPAPAPRHTRSYNLALARFSTATATASRSCSTRSERIQGDASRDQASSRHEVDKGCKR